jgi:hypothetical protein
LIECVPEAAYKKQKNNPKKYPVKANNKNTGK